MSIWRVRIGASLEQFALCVTLRGVGTTLAVSPPLERVTLEVAPWKDAFHVDGSLPRHCSASSNECVVVLCSKYSMHLVQPSLVLGHIPSGVQRQQVADSPNRLR